MKKGRHRRYEEARKFKQRTSSIDDIDLDTDPFFGSNDDREDGDDDGYDQYADLAEKYNGDGDGDTDD